MKSRDSLGHAREQAGRARESEGGSFKPGGRAGGFDQSACPIVVVRLLVITWQWAVGGMRATKTRGSGAAGPCFR
jgi:hypothetical protein